MSSTSELMTIGEMIDSAFGDPEKNVVHHKLIQAILYLLARQLRMLDRRVKIELFANADFYSSESSIIVSEVKIHANVKKKRRAQKGPGGPGGPPHGVHPSGGGGGGGYVGGGVGGGGGGVGGKSSPPRGKGSPTRGGATSPSGRSSPPRGHDKTGLGKGGHPRSTTGETSGSARGGTTSAQISTTASGKAVTTSKATGQSISKTQERGTSGKQMLGTSDRSTDDQSLGSMKSSAEKFSGDKSTTDKSSTEKSSTLKSSTEKSSTEKSSTEKSSTEKSSTEKSTTQKSLTQKSSTEKSSTEKSSTEKSSTEKPSTEKSSTEKSSTDKSSTEKSSAEKSSAEKSSAEKSSAEKSSAEKSSTEKSSTDKTITEPPTEKTTTSLDRTSSFDKTLTEISTTEKITSSDKTSTDKSSTEKSTDKSSAEKSTDKSSTEKSSTDKSTTDKSSTEKTATEKTTTDKSSTEKSSTDKSTTDKSSSAKTPTTSTEKTSTQTTSDKTTISSSTKGTGTTSSSKHTSRPRPRRGLSVFEMEREQELRIIRQRADSREERDKTPTPLASMDSVEVQYEKLLVVERVSSEEAKARTGRLQGEIRGAAPRLSIVTQEEFSKLATVVRRLQEKFDPIGAADFPENIQLMQELRKGASLTDAMAALQLSARLEAAEKALERMTGIVTELASNYPDVDLTEITQPMQTGPATEVLYQGSSGPGSQVPRLSKTPAFKQPPKPQKSKPKGVKVEESTVDAISLAPLAPEEATAPEADVAVVEEEKDNPDWITVNELDAALQEVYDNIMNSLHDTINKNKSNADAALKMANRLESKLNASLELGTRMSDLETFVASYTEQINTLDAGLSSQMTNYQEQLTQMQHDLESGLENMAEALANTGGDTAAVAELNGHFTNLQLDFETTNIRQNELREIQMALKSDLEELKREIELLRGTKSDRDEVADALRDKVGLGVLNGLVSVEQFDAVRGDMEQRIGAAYDKFNNQEIVWQKAIDDLLRELGEKADWTQVMFLRDDIKLNIEKLRSRLKDMLDIVGEPQAAAVARKLHRDANCLSCSTPAHMHLEEPDKFPALPAMPGARPPTLGAESPPKLEEGVCYPGLPVTHPRDPRAHICNRYCGGSHTKIPATLSRAPPGMLINPAGRNPADVKTDEKIIRKPCIPCNIKPKDKPRKFAEKPSKDVKEDDMSSDMTPVDFRMTSINTAGTGNFINSTPPAAGDED